MWHELHKGETFLLLAAFQLPTQFYSLLIRVVSRIHLQLPVRREYSQNFDKLSSSSSSTAALPPKRKKNLKPLRLQSIAQKSALSN